ncbi:MAG: hypothetical protein AAGF67_14115 [Verrucomicrobiota bacterium]
MNNPENLPSGPDGLPSPAVETLSKRDYFAVHLFDAATSKLSLNCSLQDKAQYAVEAADALLTALEEKS